MFHALLSFLRLLSCWKYNQIHQQVFSLYANIFLLAMVVAAASQIVFVNEVTGKILINLSVYRVSKVSRKASCSFCIYIRLVWFLALKIFFVLYIPFRLFYQFVQERCYNKSVLNIVNPMKSLLAGFVSINWLWSWYVTFINILSSVDLRHNKIIHNLVPKLWKIFCTLWWTAISIL